MLLRDIKQFLDRQADKPVFLRLPTGDPTPFAFHIIEVGHMRGTFMDGDGQTRETHACRLRVRVGGRRKHWLDAAEMLAVLRMASEIFPGEDLPVEFQFENDVLTQYAVAEIEGWEEILLFRMAEEYSACDARPGGIRAPSADPVCC